MLAGMGDHQYARALASEGAHPRQRMVKVGKELAGLAADLPLDARSSVFVRPHKQDKSAHLNMQEFRSICNCQSRQGAGRPCRRPAA